MKISVFGLGYVGVVSAGCLAKDGHTVIGVDPYKPKVDLVNEGKTPVIEKEIGEIIEKAVDERLLSATDDAERAVMSSTLSLICVGTPSNTNGSLDLKFVRSVCEEIGSSLRNKTEYHVVVVRSTMLPGSVRSLVIPVLEEKSGKRAGSDFGVCINPEFLRESTAVYDYYNPPKTVIGEIDSKAGDFLVSIYEGLKAPLIRTGIETAEMVKYTDNVWHALKVGFANEIGGICKDVGIDSHQVMDIFCLDTKLNLSPYYLRPGFAFGGSCLPKDVRALTYKARSLDLETPILNSILQSNKRQIEKGLSMITSKGKKKIGILGFSFKSGTDDLRESPLVEIIETLIGKGYDIRLYDKNVSIASLVGANRDYILNHIPHISRLMLDDIDEVISFAEVVVIGNGSDEFKDLVDKIDGEKIIVDFVRVSQAMSSGRYDGICW